MGEWGDAFQIGGVIAVVWLLENVARTLRQVNSNLTMIRHRLGDTDDSILS